MNEILAYDEFMHGIKGFVDPVHKFIQKKIVESPIKRV